MYESDGIMYAGKPNKMIKVVGVKPLNDYRILLSFSTGEKKVYDVKPLLSLSVFQPLNEKSVFDSVQLDFDTVTWCNGNIDIAPETLYEQSQAYEVAV